MTLEKIDHTFSYDQLSYDAKPNYQPYLKLSFFFSKLPDVSYEHFHKHWECIHADLTVGTKAFRTHKIQRYVQFHQTPELKEMVKTEGMESLDFDGCSEIFVKDYADWENFLTSQEFVQSLMPDTPRFMAMPIKVMAGYENVIYGAALEELGGKAGVTAETPRSDGK